MERTLMVIEIPDPIGYLLDAAVSRGKFASAQEALTKAVLLLLCDIDRGPLLDRPVDRGDTGMGSLGAMRDSAEELDRIVEDAMRARRGENWRDDVVE